MPDRYNENNITKYITSTISLIFLAEYPTFVNYWWSQTLFQTLRVFYQRTTHVYTSFFYPSRRISIAPNILPCFFNVSRRISYLCESYDRKHFSNTQGILPAYYTCIYLVLLSMNQIERTTHEYTAISSLIRISLFYQWAESSALCMNIRILHPWSIPGIY